MLSSLFSALDLHDIIITTTSITNPTAFVTTITTTAVFKLFKHLEEKPTKQCDQFHPAKNVLLLLLLLQLTLPLLLLPQLLKFPLLQL